MCLIALALDRHPRFPLVIAANRDEYLHRPAAALDWWRASATSAPVLGGRDLQAGGTWMGLGTNGRIAMLTNVRDPARHVPTAPSRGGVVTGWLGTRASVDAYWSDTAARGHNPFNLLVGDVAAGQWWWADDRAVAPQPLGPGLYGLSNAALDTPWPKVTRLKAALAAALEMAASSPELEALLFTALADRFAAPDHALPDTGVGIERERRLAPAFIRTPDGRYGTRCSTLFVIERDGERTHARMVERQFDASGAALGQRGVRLTGWPSSNGDMASVQVEAISSI